MQASDVQSNQRLLGDEALEVAMLPVAPRPDPSEASYEEQGEMGPLYSALATAQGAFLPIQRTRTVQVKTKTGGSYTFDYAELFEVIRKTRPALSANGLCVIQPVHGLEPGKVLTTKLCHSSGASITLRMRVPEANDIQELGSSLTYLCRYSMSCLLSVSADGEDDDGNAAEGNAAQGAPKQAKPQQAPRNQPAAESVPRNTLSKELKAQIWEIAQKQGLTSKELHVFGQRHEVDLSSCGDPGGKVVLDALLAQQVSK